MRRAIALGAAILLVAGAGAVVWAYGKPQSERAVSVAPTTGAGVSPAVGGAPQPVMPGMPRMGAGDPSARGKQAPAPDPDSPLAIEIPGCRCHSDDPKLVEEHAQYRMNQCFGCHTGGRCD